MEYAQITKTTEEPIATFDVKAEGKVITALSKVFKYAEQPMCYHEALAAKPTLSRMDPQHICLIEAKTCEAKLVLYKFIDVSKKDIKPPGQEIEDRFKLSEHGGTYNLKYLKQYVNILSATGSDEIRVKTAKDMPMIIENKHFKVWIAPCSESDDI